MQCVMCTQPEIAHAVRRLWLLDQLQLTLELLKESRETETELSSNVIPFRPRRPTNLSPECSETSPLGSQPFWS